MYFLKGGMDIFVGKNKETEVWKGFASCPKSNQMVCKCPSQLFAPNPLPVPVHSAFKGNTTMGLRCVCQPSPSPDYLLAEVCKKVIFPSKLAFRSWRLNKRTCDQFIAQGWRCSQPGPQLASPSKLSECGAA